MGGGRTSVALNKPLDAIFEDLIPDQDNVKSIGSSDKRWLIGFITALVATSIAIGAGVGLSEVDGRLFVNASTDINGSLYVKDMLGIGETDPVRPLHISGINGIMALFQRNDVAGTSGIHFNNTAQQWFTGMNSQEDYVIQDTNTGNLVVQIREGSSADVLTIDADKAGFGTTDPTHTLSVVGKTNLTAGATGGAGLFLDGQDMGLLTDNLTNARVTIMPNSEDQPTLYVSNLKTTTGGSSERLAVFEYRDDPWGSGQLDTNIVQILSTGLINAGCADCTQLDLIHTGTINDPDFYALSIRDTIDGTVNAGIFHNGTIVAKDYWTRSVGYDGDALSIIKNVKTKVRNGGFSKIDHSSAGEMAVIRTFERPLVITSKGEEGKEIETITGFETVTQEFISSEKTNAVQNKALQQLLDKIERMEMETCFRDPTYSWC